MIDNYYTGRAIEYQTLAEGLEFKKRTGKLPSISKLIEAHENAAEYYKEGRDFVNAKKQYLAELRHIRTPEEITRINNQIDDLAKESKKVVTFLTKVRTPLEDKLKKKTFAFLSMISLIGALASISMNLTGAAIGGSLDNNNWISIGLFFLGCAFTLFYFRAKNKNIENKKK